MIKLSKLRSRPAYNHTEKKFVPTGDQIGFLFYLRDTEVITMEAYEQIRTELMNAPYNEIAKMLSVLRQHFPREFLVWKTMKVLRGESL